MKMVINCIYGYVTVFNVDTNLHHETPWEEHIIVAFCMKNQYLHIYEQRAVLIVSCNGGGSMTIGTKHKVVQH